ncbi:MAG: ABC transporter permease [Phycisphaerales bacterium]
MIPTLIGITFLVFMLVALAPGGIGAGLSVSAGAMQSQASVARTRAMLDDRYGLDDPAPVQYIRWLGRISPIKFGTRDLVGPGNVLIRSPKVIKDPPLWQWFVDQLPAPPKPAERYAEMQSVGFPSAERTERFKEADRHYADARAEYIGHVTSFKEALGAYAREISLPRGVDSKGQGRPRVLRAHSPDKSSASFQKLHAAWNNVETALRDAKQARADLLAAFQSGPYPKAGVPIIPGMLSLTKPDFGVTFTGSQPVIELVAKRLPVTLLINLIAFPIIYLIAIPGGMLAATKRGSAFDVGFGTVSIAMWSFPVVLAGVLAIGFLANKQYLPLFPASGLHDNNADAMRLTPHLAEGAFHRGYLLDTLWHICLPVICLVYGGYAVLGKQCRAAMLDNFSADYVRTAKAKGVSAKDVVFRHVFRNSLLPLITMFVTIFPAMLAGSVIIEKIFSVPGMGSLILEAIQNRDRELLLANTLMIATVNVSALLLADVLYALADPRIAYD